MAVTTADCPNCSSSAAKRVILWAQEAKSSDCASRTTLLRCSACSCGFFHPAKLADYHAEPSGGHGALAFYLQQGAGLWGITSNLSDLDRPPGTRLLEIGCGFGFGLDFARRALGWEVLGLDPSPIAAVGRAQLGLPIQARYMVPDDPEIKGQFDVVMASEVIEHVPSPPQFARTLQSALCNGGSLVLTTPDVEAVAPATPRGQLVPLLSLGFHLVLQSRSSLATLLRQAGFEDVTVNTTGGASLIARCCRGSPPVRSAEHRTRALYRGYLRDAAARATPDGDLWFGLTARAYREAVNAADVAIADRLWREFAAACERRFGFNPENPLGALPPTALGAMPPWQKRFPSQVYLQRSLHRLLDGLAAAWRRRIGFRLCLPPGAQETEALGALAARQPLCLGPVLLHRALHHLHDGANRSAVEGLFERAAQACQELRRALQSIGTDDGDTEDCGWVAQAEALLCAAERGAAQVPERFAGLAPAPADAANNRYGRARRTDHFRRRLFVSLVNSGCYEDADRLGDVLDAITVRRAQSTTTVLADDELDVLYCGAIRELQRQPSAPALALELLARLQTASQAAREVGRLGSASTLVGPILQAQIVAFEILGSKKDADIARSKLTAYTTAESS